MKEINLYYKNKKRSILIEENWEELSQERFLTACQYLLANSASKLFPDSQARKMLKIPHKIWKSMNPALKFQTAEENLSFLKTKPEFRENKIPVLKSSFCRLHGYDSMFRDITWEEFIYADTLFMQQKYAQALAIIYRPKNIFGKRVDFDITKLNKNTKRINKINEDQIFAAILSYQAVRTKAIEKKYKLIFKEKNKTFFNGKEIKDDSEKKNPTSSWADIHHNIMGDQAYEEEKFLKSKATTILNWMNRRIKENIETERRMRK